MSDRPHHSLAALAGAALAIPGLSLPSQAAEVLTETVVQYQASAYREQDLDKDKLSGGSAKRYDIDSHQLRVATPLNDSTDLAIDLTYETMSGASPWFILPGQKGPVQVMSGASIEEQRKDLQATVNRLLGERASVSVKAGASEENDYFAVNAGLEGLYEFDDGLLSLTAGVGYSDDELEPTDGDILPDRVDEASKDATTAFVGLSRILSPQTVVQGSLSVAVQRGYLSDPYKKVWQDDISNTVADQRPERREEWVGQLRLRHFVPDWKGALHVDYRYFDDDWDIRSHTVDLAWYQNLPGGWMLTPSLRYYSQTQAFFYAPYFFSARADGMASSDYRLSPYGAWSLRLRAAKQWGQLGLHAEWEGYEASADYALDDVELENPSLVSFQLLSLGLTWQL